MFLSRLNVDAGDADRESYDSCGGLVCRLLSQQDPSARGCPTQFEKQLDL
jgi:hypothetical protein